MSRIRGTKSNGSSFDDSTIYSVWDKGRIVSGADPNKKRKDTCGAWIEYNQYGVTIENGTGWEIDHIVPVSIGGSDSISNLQPLQWQNNRHKSEYYPYWDCIALAKL